MSAEALADPTVATPANAQPGRWFLVLLPVFGGFIGGAMAAAMVWERSRRAALLLFAAGLVTTGAFAAVAGNLKDY